MRDFGFAFNDNDFSDRVLRIEIISDADQCEGCDCVPNRKRKRTDGSQTLNQENGDAAHSSDDLDLECSACVEVKTLHLSSPILAEKSPFFYKLFKNGMRESQERHVTLRIIASEEAALMDLLKFIYDNTLSATTAADLLNVLMTADKFEVISCMRYCSELLKELPISLESALSYLNLPSGVLMAEAVQPLKDAAKNYLIENYSDITDTKSRADMMALPLHAVEVVLGSARLQTNTEDGVLKFILKWARAHYPKLEERREIITKRLAQFICFPNLSSPKLKKVLVFPDFDHEQVSKLVLEALFLKVDAPYEQHNHPSGRVYKEQLIKVVHFKLPQPRCVVYWDLKKEDCAALFPAGEELLSQPFFLGGKCFGLMVECTHQQETSSHHIGVFVQLNDSSGTCMMDMEFEVMERRSKEFQSQRKLIKITLTSDDCVGFRTSWTNFIGDNSEYFIDGILHLRATLTINDDSQA